MRLRLLMVALVIGACVKHRPAPIEPLPAMMQGRFTDDYGSGYTIGGNEWRQGRGLYRIVKVNAAAMYLIAHNDSATGDRGKWTRIDWMSLPGMPPWEWAYCYSAYNAPSADSAEKVTVAKRDTPRTGCNGFPFSRMKRAP